MRNCNIIVFRSKLDLLSDSLMHTLYVVQQEFTATYVLRVRANETHTHGWCLKLGRFSGPNRTTKQQTTWLGVNFHALGGKLIRDWN